MELECPICTEYLTNNFKTNCCNQEIHSDCFEKCISLNNSCPFCRTNSFNNQISISININPLLIQETERRPPNYCSFCSSLIFCFFTIIIISGIIGFPVGNYFVTKNINFTKSNNTLNFTEIN